MNDNATDINAEVGCSVYVKYDYYREIIIIK